MQYRREFIKQIGFGAAGYGLLSAFPGNSFFGADDGLQLLPRSTPEEQGVSSAVISRFLDEIIKSGQEFHSLMILRHGSVIAEGWWHPYYPEHRMQLYSLSKSFTSTAIGMAVAEKLLSVDDQVISFFKDDLPEKISDNLAALKVKHLLSMSVGHEKDSIMIIEKSPAGTPWARTFLSLPVVYTPGSRFLYNSGASFMLSAIVKKVSGKTAHEFLKPRLYDPLKITTATWTENPDGINMGASHLRMRTEDLAKFGQLYLQKGMWNGNQLIPSSWVTEATSKQIENGKNDSSWGYGYGYQFWLNPPGGYRADGAFGQYSMVLPKQNAVVVITSESISTKTTMQIVWDHLVPQLERESPFPKNQGELKLLKKNLSSLAYVPDAGTASMPLEQHVQGKEYLLEENPFKVRSVSFRFTGKTCVFTVKQESVPDVIIACGKTGWITAGNKKPLPHSLFSLRRIDFDSLTAATATWTDEKTLLICMRFIETVHGDRITCTFDGDTVKLQFLFSVNYLEHKPDDRLPITGRSG